MKTKKKKLIKKAIKIIENLDFNVLKYQLLSNIKVKEAMLKAKKKAKKQEKLNKELDKAGW